MLDMIFGRADIIAAVYAYATRLLKRAYSRPIKSNAYRRGLTISRAEDDGEAYRCKTTSLISHL